MIEIALLVLFAANIAIFIGLKKINSKSYIVISKIQNQIENADKNFDQIESLLWLYHAVKPDHPFPRFRGWAASPDFLRIIIERIREQKIKKILELGSGSSTILLGEFLKRTKSRAKIISIDERKESFIKTSHELKKRKLNKKVFLYFCPLIQFTKTKNNTKWYSVPMFVFKSKFDLVIIDGPSTLNDPLSRRLTIDRLKNAVASNCLFIMDDTNRPGEQEILTKWNAERKIKNLEQLPTEKGTALFNLN